MAVTKESTVHEIWYCDRLHLHLLILYVVLFSDIQNYRHSDDVKLWGYVWQITDAENLYWEKFYV